MVHTHVDDTQFEMRGGGGQSNRIARLELSKGGFRQLKKYLFSIFFPEVVLHKYWCSEFIGIVRNVRLGPTVSLLTCNTGRGVCWNVR